MERYATLHSVCSNCARRVLSRRDTRRQLSTTAAQNAEVIAADKPAPTPLPRLDPRTITTKKDELRYAKETGRMPVGPRRLRALRKQMASGSTSFDAMPYQCFQEARKVLQQDRREKIAEIEARRSRLQKLQETTPEPQDERIKAMRMKSMLKALETLKIHADINDPMIKRKFEDGQGTLDKPIYRFLADRKWREYKRKLLMQRIEQMHVVPDVLPEIDPKVSTDMYFKARKLRHGEILDSALTEHAPRIKVQPYDQGTRLLTIAVFNPDIPNVAKDSFDNRCHFLACNIPVSPTSADINLAALDAETQVLLPWSAPYSQKGLDYQRLAVCIFEQPRRDDKQSTDTNATRSQSLDLKAIRERGKDTNRDTLTARALAARHALTPVGIDLFRTKYDENTARVMKRAGVVGDDVEFKRKRIDPLPYKRMSTARYR